MSNRERTQNRTERLFAMVLLLQSGPRMTSRALAEHFGVSRRTIFRDLRALGESGVPLTYGDEGGYEILKGYQLPPLMFTGRQAAILLIGAQLMRLQSDASLRQEAEQVELKIRAVLPNRMQDYLGRLIERTELDPFQLNKMPAKVEGLWFKVSEAVIQRRRIAIEYYVAARDELTERKIDPLGMVYYVDHWNLIAKDHLRTGSIRNFRLDGIMDIFVLSERFEPPHGFDLQAHLRKQGEETDRTVIRFDKRAYQHVHPKLPAVVREERESGPFVEVTIEFENKEYLADLLLGCGAGAEVVEPKAMRTRMKDVATKVAAIYDGDNEAT